MTRWKAPPLAAKAQPDALTVMAWAPKGTLLNAPDTYMDKIACGPGLPGRGDRPGQVAGRQHQGLGRGRGRRS
ncbi:fructose-bisphosphatase class II [Caulobacter segnis]